MALTVDLVLDCRSLGKQFLDDVKTPATLLATITLKVSGGPTTAIVSASGELDVGPLNEAVERLAGRAGPLLESLPAADDVLGPITTALELIERLTAGDLATQFNAVLDRVKEELARPADGGQIALWLRIAELLRDAPEGGVLREILGLLTVEAKVDGRNASLVLEGLQALDGVVRALGGMMCLESILAEAEDLAGKMAVTLDEEKLRGHIAVLQATLRGETESLAEQIAAVTDAASLGPVIRTVGSVTTQLNEIREELAVPMAMGAATMAYLDIDRLQAEVNTARALARTADLGPLRNVIIKVAALVQPLLALDLGGTPAGGIDALLTQAETQVAQFAAAVAAFDVNGFSAPLTANIQALTAPIRDLDQVIAGVLSTLRKSLGEVRDAVAALPLDEVVATLREFVEPIATMLDEIAALLRDIQAALQTAAANATKAIGDINVALDKLKIESDKFFGKARSVIEKADIGAAIGAVAENVQSFSERIAKAEMKPYFDTAITAIDTAADVVGAVPFGLFPESMKADLDAAVKPIKDVDVEEMETTIEDLLGISGGTFTPRDDLEAAVAALYEKFQDLLETIEAQDPRVLLDSVQDEMQALAGNVRKLEPELTLKPVRDAIDRVKRVVQSTDLQAALAPVNEAFDEILGALDRYSPSQLMVPVQARIAAARTALKTQIRLDEWVPALDDLKKRATEFLEIADPARLEAPLRGAFAEIKGILDTFPTADATAGLGTVVAALLGTTGLRIHPSSFPEAKRWIAGEASGTAALSGRTDRIARRIETVHAQLQAIDLPALTAGVTTAVSEVKAAVSTLIDKLPLDTAERTRLAGLLPSLDAAVIFDDLVENRVRFLDVLREATARAGGFQRGGFSEVDVAAADLRSALDPLRPAGDKVGALFAAMGVSPDEIGVAGVLRTVLDAAPPERITGIVMPVFTALQGRLEALLSAVIEPLQAAAGDLGELLDGIDLAPLITAADAVVGQLETEILQLSPSEVLREPLQSFNGFKTAFKETDPLDSVNAILTALRDAIARLLEKLDLEKILAEPLAIYDFILAELRKIAPRGLLTPLYDQLDEIAAQVDTGLDETVVSFKRLQEAVNF